MSTTATGNIVRWKNSPLGKEMILTSVAESLTAEEFLFGTKEEIENDEAAGMITVDSEFGKEIGFTSDNFERGCHLWKIDNNIFISIIEAKYQGRGVFSALVKKIESLKFSVLVPTPLAQMEKILKRWGWGPKFRTNGRDGECISWGRP